MHFRNRNGRHTCVSARRAACCRWRAGLRGNRTPGGLPRTVYGNNSPSTRKDDIMNFASPYSTPLQDRRRLWGRVDEPMALLDTMKGFGV